ncbi:MAG: hypothetical protein WC663_02510 [Patescibacteria group bacterium]|jgi:hypothetical protein
MSTGTIVFEVIIFLAMTVAIVLTYKYIASKVRPLMTALADYNAGKRISVDQLYETHSPTNIKLAMAFLISCVCTVAVSFHSRTATYFYNSPSWLNTLIIVFFALMFGLQILCLAAKKTTPLTKYDLFFIYLETSFHWIIALVTIIIFIVLSLLFS